MGPGYNKKLNGSSVKTEELDLLIEVYWSTTEELNLLAAVGKWFPGSIY